MARLRLLVNEVAIGKIILGTFAVKKKSSLKTQA